MHLFEEKNLSVCTHLSIIFVTQWTVTCQDLLPMDFSRQEYWHGLPFPSPEDLADPEIMCLLHWQANSWPSEPPGKPIYIYTPFCIYIHFVYIYMNILAHTVSLCIFSQYIYIYQYICICIQTHMCIHRHTYIHTEKEFLFGNKSIPEFN